MPDPGLIRFPKAMATDVPPPPSLAGRLTEYVALAPRTTWRIGGPARWLATFETHDALQIFWSRLSPETPRFVLGGGSNILVSDAGFDGVVLDLSCGINRITLQSPAGKETPEAIMVAEAGASTRSLAHAARRLGLSGTEFLSGIPGSVGGALVMNAGAHGRELKDILIDAVALDPDGQRHTLTPNDLQMNYRHTHLPHGWIFTAARFRLTPLDPGIIRQTMQRYNHYRRTHQPLSQPSAGSTFKNPPQGSPAWQLIAASGMRGAAVGDARVSDKHCNFFVNMGHATATDMTQLIRNVRDAVFSHSGITLETEVALLQPRGLTAF